MEIIIPDEILQATHMSEEEVKQELAVLLFQKDKITIGQASWLAGMSQLQFQHLLASRKFIKNGMCPQFINLLQKCYNYLLN